MFQSSNSSELSENEDLVQCCAVCCQWKKL